MLRDRYREYVIGPARGITPLHFGFIRDYARQLVISEHVVRRPPSLTLTVFTSLSLTSVLARRYCSGVLLLPGAYPTHLRLTCHTSRKRTEDPYISSAV